MTAFVVAIALCYVLIKIPFWILGSIKISQGGSVLGSMAKAFLAYKTFGLAGAGAKKALGAFSARRTSPMQGRGWTRPDPYEQTTWESDGQGVLPLAGVGPSSWGPRARRAAASSSSSTSPELARRSALYAHPRAGQGRQGSLLTRSGVAKPLPRDRRPPPHPGVPRQARPGEQTMLRIHTRYEPGSPPRESLHEAMSRPEAEPPAVPDEAEQPRMFTPDGRIRAHARPSKAGPGDVPAATIGQQQALNMRLRLSPEQARRRARHLATPDPPEQEQPVTPDPSPPVPRTRGQQPLLHQDGSLNPRARSRNSRHARRRAPQHGRQQRRRVHSAPAAPEFQPPPPPPTRRGRTAPAPKPPAPEAPATARTSGRRQRSTRLNTPTPRKENTDE